MKKLILSELLLLFLATTFVTDSLPPGWYQQTLPVNKTINDIFFLDSLTGWVVTNSNLNPPDSGYIIKTTDAGNNWVIQNEGITRFNVVQFLNANTGYAGAEVPTAEIYKSTNGGTNWNLVSSMLTGLTDMFFVNNDTGWYCDPSSFGGIFKTINGGVNWSPQMSGNNFPKKLFFINKDTGWAISNEANSKLYMTTNGGSNWNLRYTFSTNPASMYFINSQVGWIGGAGTGNGIQYTTNSGFNWINSQGYTGGGYDIKFINDSIGFTGRVPQILKSTDGGKNWGSQQMNSNTYRSVSVLRNDTLLAWTGTFSLMHTSDGGGSINFLGITQISTEIPSDFKLYQNYPNPFNPGTIIRFQIERLADLKLSVYDIRGKEISVLANGEYKPGTYELEFSGSGLSSGVYFYKITITAGKEVFTDTKKMVLIK